MGWLSGTSFWIAVMPVEFDSVTIFPLFLTMFAIQGFHVVRLPLNIYARARRLPDTAGLTRRAAGVIVAALQIGAISGALTAGQLRSLEPVDVGIVDREPAGDVASLVSLPSDSVPL